MWLSIGYFHRKSPKSFRRELYLMPLFVFRQLFLSLSRYNRLLFKVNMLSILVLKNIEIGEWFSYQHLGNPLSLQRRSKIAQHHRNDIKIRNWNQIQPKRIKRTIWRLLLFLLNKMVRFYRCLWYRSTPVELVRN